MPLLIIGIVILLIIVFVVFGFRVIRPVERGIVERFGKYHRVVDQGLRWLIPLVDRLIRANITEVRIDVDKQSVITKDNLNLEVDAVVYYKIKDVLRSVYTVDDFAGSIPSLAQTTLRSVIGELEFTQVNAQRQIINNKIEKELDVQTSLWGIDITKVELQHVRPADDVQKAMDQVVTAEREKEAKVIQAVARKESTKEIAQARIIQAAAEKQVKIERATGEAEAIKLKAGAESEAVRVVNKAVEETFLEKARAFKTLEVTENSLAKNSKFIISEHGVSPSIIVNETDTKVAPISPSETPKRNTPASPYPSHIEEI